MTQGFELWFRRVFRSGPRNVASTMTLPIITLPFGKVMAKFGLD